MFGGADYNVLLFWMRTTRAKALLLLNVKDDVEQDVAYLSACDVYSNALTRITKNRRAIPVCTDFRRNAQPGNCKIACAGLKVQKTAHMH